MAGSNETGNLRWAVGTCCPAELCIYPHLQLFLLHKFVLCNEIVHVTCGTCNKDDKHQCFKCLCSHIVNLKVVLAAEGNKGNTLPPPQESSYANDKRLHCEGK